MVDPHEKITLQGVNQMLLNDKAANANNLNDKTQFEGLAMVNKEFLFKSRKKI